MFKSIPMRKTLLLLLWLSCIATGSFAGIERLGLKAAMDKGLIQVKAMAANSGYRKIKLQVKNNTGKAMQLTVDPGLIFKPADTGYQDLVIPGGDMLVLTGKNEQTLELNSFCGKSYASSPVSGLTYAFSRQGDSGMIKVLAFISAHKLYNDLGQHAVWALTNNHELSAVFDPENAAVSQQLLALLSAATGKPVPDYYRYYAIDHTPGHAAFVPKLLKMYARFEWNQETPKVMTLGIYNEAGDMIQPVAENQEFVKGGNRVTIEFEAENVKAGKYFIRLMDGKTVIKEQMVVVD